MMRNDNLSSVNQQLTVISTNSRNSSPSAGEIIFFLSLVSTQLAARVTGSLARHNIM